MSKLPEVVDFENVGRCFYQRLGFRAPRKGEYYLSGAIMAAYEAKADMMSSYHVVKPVALALRRVIEERGSRV